MPVIPNEILNEVGVALELIVAIITATLVALWISMALWTLRDIHSRTRDIFAWILATLLVLLTGPVGLLLYNLLRPRETLAAVFDRQLEEEALLRDITTRRACPSCQGVTEPDWLVCPHCRTELRRLCDHCQRPLDLNWVVCPYCATEVTPNLPMAQPIAASWPEPVPANGSVQAGAEAIADDASRPAFGA
jgi:RNA polymerase subunit RPABC4/transcription elongation factor Spt4